MSKRIHYIFAVLSIVLLSLTLQTFTPVLGLNAIYTDPENDVYRIKYPSQDIKKGDYHDEIDIVKLEINEQAINLTFAGNIADWQNSSFDPVAIIVLHPDFKGMDEESYPYYGIVYENWTNYGLGYRVFLTYYTDSYPYEEYWDGSGWVDSEDLAVEVGSASNKSITADVPTDALNITDDLTFIAQSMCVELLALVEEAYIYMDIAPNKYDPFASEDKIPSYNLFIVVGLLFGISLIIIKKQIKSK